MGAITNEKGRKKLTGGVIKGQNMKTPRLTGRRVSRLVGGLGKLVPKHLRVSVAGSRFLINGTSAQERLHRPLREPIFTVAWNESAVNVV